MPDFGVLFVCTGNICRSPTAEGVLRHRLAEAGLGDRVEVDSCGVGSWHVGSAPTPHAVDVASRKGYDLSGLRARTLSKKDFARFDLLIAMDRGHHGYLLSRCPDDKADRLRLFLEFAPSYRSLDVPDPYMGEVEDYERMLEMIETGVEGLLQEIRDRVA